MSRIWVAILTIIIYALAQFLPSFIMLIPSFQNLSRTEMLSTSLYIQVALFILAAIIIIGLHLFIKNPIQLERSYKEPKRFLFQYALLGFIVVMIYQMVASLINMLIFGQPQQSPNTERLMEIAKQMPIFIILISVVGPILEEYVFRKVLFGELYNRIKSNKIVSFLIASIISSLLFAIAHNDIKFILVYFGMGMIFSLAYVLTKRIAVPIMIHMFQNGFVVLIQVFFGDSVKQIQEQANMIINFFM